MSLAGRTRRHPSVQSSRCAPKAVLTATFQKSISSFDHCFAIRTAGLQSAAVFHVDLCRPPSVPLLACGFVSRSIHCSGDASLSMFVMGSWLQAATRPRSWHVPLASTKVFGAAFKSLCSLIALAKSVSNLVFSQSIHSCFASSFFAVAPRLCESLLMPLELGFQQPTDYVYRHCCAHRSDRALQDLDFFLACFIGVRLTV